MAPPRRAGGGPAVTATRAITEADARRLLLLQAVEAAPESALWTAEDRRWASRAATQAAGAEAPRDAWLAERARLAAQRLAPRDAALRAVLAHRLWWPGAAGLALGIGALIGALSDTLLAGDYFNLLSLPFFGLLAWNLALYALLAVLALRGARAHGPLRGALARGMTRWIRRAASTALLADFARRWAAASAPLVQARSTRLMHLAAAGLALGLVAGMYTRALVFDYRAGWATTLLAPAQVRAVLATVFAPAQAISGIAVPDTAGIAALQITPATPPQASAAPWLHLMALTLLLVVALPRAVLSVLAARQVRRLERRFPLALDGPYFDRLRPPPARDGLALWVLPHGAPVPAPAAAALRDWVTQALGEATPLQIAEPVAYGDEDTAPASVPPGRPLLLFDLAATPEAEVHGRLLRAVSGHPLIVVDEAGFVRRFGRGERLAERRAAWQSLAEATPAPLLFVNLDAPDAAAADALRTAVAH